MANGKAPGKYFREGISTRKLYRMFPDDETAEAWFVSQRWPDGVRCAYCDSERVQVGTTHPTMPFRCRKCRKFFSVKTGTVMQSSKLGYQTWILAIYYLTTNIKGIASMKLRREIDVTQKTAWFLAHRLRDAYMDDTEGFNFFGPAEADETFIGGKEGNKHSSKKLRAGRGTVGKSVVVGIKDRPTNLVKVKVVEDTTASTLQGFVHANTEVGTQVYTDEARAYEGMNRPHDSVAHGAGEYVKAGDIHTNGIESYWSLFKRGYYGIYHLMSKKHLHRYANEFAARHNVRPLDTKEQMTAMVKGMKGKRLRYIDLIGPVGTRLNRGA